MSVPDSYAVLRGALPTPARLSELLETYGGVSGEWTEGLECAGLSIGKSRLDRPLRALFNRMLDAKRKEPFTPVSVVRLVGRSHDTLEDVAEALLLDCGGVVFREDGSSLTYVPVPKTKTPKPSTKKITKKIFDGSIPEEVEARFGHEQGPYKLGCRDPITVKLPAVVKAVGVKGKFGFSDGGGWTASLGYDICLSAMGCDRGFYAATLSTLGVEDAQEVLWVSFSTWFRTSCNPEDWRAMLQILCAIGRHTRGVLWKEHEGMVVASYDFAGG